MRIVSYVYDGRVQAGVLADGDRVVPLSALGVAGGDINALFDLCQTAPLDEVFSFELAPEMEKKSREK